MCTLRLHSPNSKQLVVSLTLYTYYTTGFGVCQEVFQLFFYFFCWLSFEFLNLFTLFIIPLFQKNTSLFLKKNAQIMGFIFVQLFCRFCLTKLRRGGIMENSGHAGRDRAGALCKMHKTPRGANHPRGQVKIERGGEGACAPRLSPPWRSKPCASPQCAPQSHQ